MTFDKNRFSLLKKAAGIKRPEVEIPEDDLVRRARLFATHHHAAVGQKRKYSGEDYITHPAAVVAILKSVTSDPITLAAGWAHDTVEDTKATHEMVCNELGAEVGLLIEGLTDISKLEDGNRPSRKAIDRAHTAAADPRAKTAKLADLIHNGIDIVAHDVNFAKVFLHEKSLLLPVLTEGDQTLWKAAHRVLEAGQHALVQAKLAAKAGLER
jgi:(p)ppGpp synthase/HD superfamily hydrolase